MCKSYRLIDENEFAYSAYNKTASIIQFNFGNICLKLTHDEFTELKKHVKETLEGSKNCKCPYARDIFISTSVTNMVFVFCLHEIMCIYDVMMNTATMLEVQDILEKGKL
ncbi:MAG: DUF6686 family protein [Bacteroidota bacterium]